MNYQTILKKGIEMFKNPLAKTKVLGVWDELETSGNFRLKEVERLLVSAIDSWTRDDVMIDKVYNALKLVRKEIK